MNKVNGGDAIQLTMTHLVTLATVDGHLGIVTVRRPEFDLEHDLTSCG